MSAKRPLAGCVALVSGASSGIGRESAIALAREGVEVALMARRREELEATARTCRLLDRRVLAFPGDVSQRTDVVEVVSAVQREFGRVDILVNSAGINIPGRAFDTVSLEDWERVFAVNVTGAFLLAQRCLGMMRAQRSGTIVNISSIAGRSANTFAGPAYCASKAALNSLTESINLAERHHGIRACTVCPGEVDTPWLDARPEPPTAGARAQMLRASDVAEVVAHVARLPSHASVELLVVQPAPQEVPSHGESPIDR